MKIICIGRNYVAHAEELRNEVPAEPIIFLKPKTALVKAATVPYPGFTEDFQYEAEIVLKISKNGRNIKQEQAQQYFDSYTIGIDFTARDVQQKLKNKGLPWEISKAFDKSCAAGSFIPYPTDASTHTIFDLFLNDKKVQSGNTQNMIFSFEKIISYASQFFTLEMGDLIYTGTPAGVGPLLPYDSLTGYLNGEQLLQLEIV